MRKIELTCPFCKNSNISIRRNMQNHTVCNDCTKDNVFVILSVFLPGEKITVKNSHCMIVGGLTDKQRREKFAQLILDKRLYFLKIDCNFGATKRYQLKRVKK